MTVTLELTPEVEDRLRLDAQEQGTNIQDYLQKYLASLPRMTGADYGRLFSQPLTEKEKQARLAVLDSFTEGDPEEQRETLEYLQKALAENPLMFHEIVLPDDGAGV